MLMQFEPKNLSQHHETFRCCLTQNQIYIFLFRSTFHSGQTRRQPSSQYGVPLSSQVMSTHLKLHTFITALSGHICIEFCKDVIFLKIVVKV